MTDGQAEHLLTVEQIADEFQVTSQTIRNWIKGGALPAVRVGDVYRVRRGDLDAMITRQQGETTPLGSHRDPWAPQSLGLPYKRREDDRPPSVWDGMSSPIATRGEPRESRAARYGAVGGYAARRDRERRRAGPWSSAFTVRARAPAAPSRTTGGAVTMRTRPPASSPAWDEWEASVRCSELRSSSRPPRC